MKRLISVFFTVSFILVLLIGCNNLIDNPTLSSNADLSALTVSTGTLSPTFTAETTAYTLSVPNAIDSITITGTKDDSNASLSANNGVAQNLNVGTNAITITVTAHDGTKTKDYIVEITRDSEMIVNSNFRDGFSSWNPWSIGLEGATAIWEMRDGCAWAHDIIIGSNSWDLQLMTASPIYLVQDKTYLLKIITGSKSNRSFRVKLGENGIDRDNDGSTYTPYIYFDYEINYEEETGEMQTLTFEFLYTNATDPNAQLNIEFGSSNINFEIQEISLKEK